MSGLITARVACKEPKGSRPSKPSVTGIGLIYPLKGAVCWCLIEA